MHTKFLMQQERQRVKHCKRVQILIRDKLGCNVLVELDFIICSENKCILQVIVFNSKHI